ncbi:MAG: O-antigen ligase family protein [Minisyncoccia bacterium]
MKKSIAKEIARWIALGALFIITLTPFLVVNSFFFPFITGKAFYFRIVVEIAVAAWGVLAFLDKEYRPRFSWVGAAAVAFVAWMFIADLFAPNAAKAFWSNFERMEGWVLLIHLLGFFFAASAVLRVNKQWRNWLLVSLGVALFVSGYAILQLVNPTAYPIHQGSTRIDASFGNSAYLAIYLLFSTFVALWLALTEKRAWLKWLLIAVSVLEGVLIFFTETRGTVIGLTVALALAAFLAAITAGKRVRGYAVIALAAIVLLVGGIYLARDSSFIQNNHVLQRVTSISLSDGQTRFTIWHMAFEGVLERPIVGWGQEGFNYVFNQFYDPSLYAQEPWFDRAHNAFIDWFAAGGFPAFLLYVSLFGTAIALLWRSSKLSRAERILVTAALVGYAIHNLFVFDNLYSYVYFFALLALIDSQVAKPIRQLETLPEISAADGLSYALPIGAVVAFGLVWFVNVPGIRVANELITALTPAPDSPTPNLAAFEDLTAHPAFAAQEIREQLVNFAATEVQNAQVPNAQKQQIVNLAVTEMQKQVAAYPKDAREQLELSYVYRAAGDGPDALKAIQTASALSPGKEEIWIEEGELEWDLGNIAAAQTDLTTAYKLGPQFKDLAAYAAAGDFAVNDIGDADKVLLGAYGTTTVDSDVLAVAYYRSKNWPQLIALSQLRAMQPGATVQTWFQLAAAYYTAGDKANAIKTINKAIAIFPDAAASGAAAIAQIEGKTPAGQ